jgi:hypothetical protein
VSEAAKDVSRALAASKSIVDGCDPDENFGPMASEPRIKLIAGMEPNRDGEWPITFAIGNGFPGPVKHTITRIDRREQNMGTYGILWFDVFDGDTLLASMNAMAVSEVQYADL